MSDAYAFDADRYWADDHPVLELIRSRQSADSKPGSRVDGFKLGLAVEGGGMRGVTSAAMLVALDDLGLRGVFDAVYSTSSGSINAAYFMAGGDCWYPLTIYFDDLCTRKFVDMRNMFNKRPMLNLDYAFDEVLETIKPLDFEKILKNPAEFHITISLVDSLTPIGPHEFESREDLKSALKASCWMPVAVPGTGMFRGQRALDGGVLTAHPSLLAIEDGCTHVLSLSTKPIKPPPTRLSKGRRFSVAYLERIQKGLGQAYVASQLQYCTQRKQLQRWMTEPDPGAKVLDLAPLPWMKEVGNQTRDRDVLINAARHAHAVMAAAIQGIPVSEIRDGSFRSVPRIVTVRTANGERIG
ncbi:patatin-like phospholipase family protein [Glycomyces luteolus]|uniref:Patatin-like phospholipase family protein n=1 Tax=Glycomyces luteolus TaxID=2670330 RepID=A0A9X3T433_9ACTN|nr:patatin-like phospholipase family protein [Glycomyces luteolus]MDA1360595.1 patatin-like phospholipase family protein [Glycomyces luteolus]